MAETTTKRRRISERNAALYDAETVEFIQAIDAFRRRYAKSFPAWSEVLAIFKSLGYRKVAEPVPLALNSSERDEAEQPVAPKAPTEPSD